MPTYRRYESTTIQNRLENMDRKIIKAGTKMKGNRIPATQIYTRVYRSKRL